MLGNGDAPQQKLSSEGRQMKAGGAGRDRRAVPIGWSADMESEAFRRRFVLPHLVGGHNGGLYLCYCVR